MPTLRILTLLAMLALAVLTSCVDGKGPLQPGPAPTATLTVRPLFSSGALAGGAQAVEINRIRVRVRQVPGNALLGTVSLDVDPNADEWPVTVEFPLPDEESVQVVLEILLIHVGAGGEETVEFSGQVGPLEVTSGTNTSIQQVEVVRGPLKNLSVTSVTILPEAVPTLFPGDTVRLRAQVTTSDPNVNPTVFWSSLAPSVAVIDGSGLITGVAPGVAGLVAVAGARADTAQVTVVERPRDATYA